jgi:hypothetical protein
LWLDHPAYQPLSLLAARSCPSFLYSPHQTDIERNQADSAAFKEMKSAIGNEWGTRAPLRPVPLRSWCDEMPVLLTRIASLRAMTSGFAGEGGKPHRRTQLSRSSISPPTRAWKILLNGKQIQRSATVEIRCANVRDRQAQDSLCELPFLCKIRMFASTCKP